MTSEVERILILCKTYPSPSAGHAETSCVAGINEKGEMRRLFPVPFRLIEDEKQFKKWQWIRARVEKTSSDHRPESRRLYIDTIECEDKPLSTDNHWRERRPWIERIPTFDNFDAVENARQKNGITLALVRPRRIVALDVKQVENPDWTEEEKAKLQQAQNQGGLFDNTDAKDMRLLKKLPFDFHYRYQCESAEGVVESRHKLVDWEAGALFWNVYRRHRSAWETPFRDKLEKNLPAADLMFLMGTIHRFPDQWLIVSLIYPPKQPRQEADQLTLL